MKSKVFLLSLLAVLFAACKNDSDNTKSTSDKVTTFAELEVADPYNGHEYVDLGLPSGLKWATMNVGATKPEEYGDHFAWGETKTKTDYSWNTYKHCNGSSSTMTKYCTSASYGTVDNKTVLESTDDAAHVNWGGAWRMPTEAEFEELLTNCNKQWTTQNGVNGYKFTSKTNSANSIFLPAAGLFDGTSLSGAGSDGYYWSSSLYASIFVLRARLVLSSGHASMNDYFRCYGLSVRPVCE